MQSIDTAEGLVARVTLGSNLGCVISNFTTRRLCAAAATCDGMGENELSDVCMCCESIPPPTSHMDLTLCVYGCVDVRCV